MQAGMKMPKPQLEPEATQERDKAEIREILRIIIQSHDDMRNLMNMQSPHDSCPVEEIMESLQTVGTLSVYPSTSERLKYVISRN